MQYSKYFFSMALISLGLAIAPGCDDATSKGGGDGGQGGDEQWGAGGAGVGSTGSSMGGGDESGVLNGITAEHNKARAGVNPPASSPIPPLVWSSDLAGVAQAYAENCVFEHSMNQYGENLYASSGGSTPQDVVGSWVDEVQDYDYASNSCSNVCGHYTQVVWAKSLRLGCGVAQCSKNSPFGAQFPNWEIWVCNYDPPGNYVGEKPY